MTFSLKAKTLLVTFFLFALAAYFIVPALWQTNHPSGIWRYRMTVAIHTPDGIKTGSNVREIHASIDPISMGAISSGHAGIFKGGAVVVDLGAKGKIFALLRGNRLGWDYAADLPFDIFPSDTGYTTADGIRYYRDLVTEPAILDRAWYPMMVRFADPKDLSSLQILQRMKGCSSMKFVPENGECPIENNFEKYLGSEYYIQEVTVQMVKDEAEVGIVEREMPKFDKKQHFLFPSDFLVGKKRNTP